MRSRLEPILFLGLGALVVGMVYRFSEHKAPKNPTEKKTTGSSRIDLAEDEYKFEPKYRVGGSNMMLINGNLGIGGDAHQLHNGMMDDRRERVQHPPEGLYYLQHQESGRSLRSVCSPAGTQNLTSTLEFGPPNKWYVMSHGRQFTLENELTKGRLSVGEEGKVCVLTNSNYSWQIEAFDGPMAGLFCIFAVIDKKRHYLSLDKLTEKATAWLLIPV